MRKPNGYYDSDRIRNIALQYNSRHQFQTHAHSAYHAARRLGILESVCRHMPPPGKPKGYWNDQDKCAEAALKYKTRTEFFQGEPGAFTAALKGGWLDTICAHMHEIKKPTGYWSKDRVKEAFQKSSSLKDFRNNSRGAYAAAQRNGWLYELRFG